MSEYVIRLRSVPLNSPRNRVWRGKEDGLWHVSRAGIWCGATSSWDRAIDFATTGRLVIS